MLFPLLFFRIGEWLRIMSQFTAQKKKKKVKDPIRNSKAELSSSENYLQPLARVSVGSRINEVIQGHWILWGD